ncbi:Retrovirus-related Pol polyprotein from type-1 retrotransposable element R2-like Protein [Tribolium castaneum]|uniref:Retrovirus-related Pol polyprotein from type-1 retrotransposable element R2-like Protein n=1 Tax=Tribolium castaneum TaxID=7070 RepID=D7GYK1_TRICA|nr:Retrovirus-related Pol polyprotein from type-1 retrotransposable element R2-like Protein [Tribolium castaneum]
MSVQSNFARATSRPKPFHRCRCGRLFKPDLAVHQPGGAIVIADVQVSRDSESLTVPYERKRAKYDVPQFHQAAQHAWPVFWMCGSPTHSQEDRADVDPALSHPPLPPPNQRLDTKKPMARLILGQVKERPTTKRLKKQGDPLSPLLFNMVIDELLHLVDNLPGGSTFKERIKYPIMAFEDDLIILEDDEAHLPNTLTTINYLLIARGMTLNPAKCHALSVAISNGRPLNRNRPFLEINGGQITMIETLNAFRYLGHNVEATGIQRPDLKNLVTWTSILQRAPLKPDQKLRILVCNPVTVHRSSWSDRPLRSDHRAL